MIAPDRAGVPRHELQVLLHVTHHLHPGQASAHRRQGAGTIISYFGVKLGNKSSAYNTHFKQIIFIFQ